MTKRNSYIAAAALAVTGTVGMASWLAPAADDFRPAPQAQLEPEASAGVAETEGVLPVVEAPDAPEAAAVVEVPMPATPTPRARVERVERVERGARTPLATRPVPAAQPERAPANSEPRANVEPRSTPEPRREPVDPVDAAEPVEPAFFEVRVPSGTILGVRLTTSVSSDTAEIEDRVEATVTRDVITGGRIAIPSGTKVLGSVNDVMRGGKFKERARLGIRFHTLVLADGTRETVRVDAIVREGDSPARASAAKIGGGALGGAILGGIMGGKKGAILGGATGAGAGTAAVAAGDRSVAALAAGTPLSVRLNAPVNVTIERNQ